MGLFDRFKKRAPTGAEGNGEDGTDGDGNGGDGGEGETTNVIVLQDAQLAATMRAPTAPNFSDEPQSPCECGKPIPEVFITTGGPAGDATVWRDYPVAVDGWACMQCGQFRYPRKISPDEITKWIEEGVSHGQAGRYGDAELAFARIVWDWPGYAAGHLNYAEATSSRIAATQNELEPQVLRKLVQRVVDNYEAGIAGYTENPTPALLPPVTRAHLRLAEIALGARALERAQRHVDAALALPGLRAADAVRAKEIGEYIAHRMDLFNSAGDALGPFLELMDRRRKESLTGDQRKTIADALVDLEEHLEHAPERWQSAWLYAKGLFAAERTDDGFAAWQRAWERFPDRIEIARDYSSDLMHAGRTAEALAINSSIAERHPTDATLWCNLAVSQMLCGDAEAAQRSLDKSTAIDPNDPVAKTVAKRLARGAPFPTTLGELERGK